VKPTVRIPTVKTHHRLGYARLAEALAESGLVDPKTLKDALECSAAGGTPFPSALVEANLVTDWDLSRIVCDLYGLPFLPVDIVEPDPEAFAGLDIHFLRDNGLIPLGRYGQVLTISMPGLVEADTLGMLAAQTDLFLLPVVGTVRSNHSWLQANIEPQPALPSNPDETGEEPQGWSSFFDDADAAVLMELQSSVDEDLDEILEPVAEDLEQGSDPAADPLPEIDEPS